MYICVLRHACACIQTCSPFIINVTSLQSYLYTCIKVYIRMFFFYTHMNIDCRAITHTWKVLHAHLYLHATRYTMTGIWLCTNFLKNKQKSQFRNAHRYLQLRKHLHFCLFVFIIFSLMIILLEKQNFLQSPSCIFSLISVLLFIFLLTFSFLVSSIYFHPICSFIFTFRLLQFHLSATKGHCGRTL